MEKDKNKEVSVFQSISLTKLPLLKVRYKGKNESFIVGDNSHDTFVLGKNGGLHYLNLQGLIGTENGEMEFDVNGVDDFNMLEEFDMFREFESINFLQLMEIDAERLGLSDNKAYLEHKNKLKEIFYEVMREKANERNKKIFEMLDEMKD